MRQVYIIGTIHNQVLRKEINNILDKLNPNQILLEIVNSHLNSNKISKYPAEMRLAYEWAKKHNKNVKGFEVKSSRKDNLTNQEIKIVKKVNEYVASKDWKYFNKKRHMDQIEKLLRPLPLLTREDKSRQKRMLKNIRKHMIRNGRIVIITGIGHLNFFEKHIPEAKFPFR